MLGTALGASARKFYLLRTAAAVVGDADVRRSQAGLRGNETHDDIAGRTTSHAPAARIAHGKIARISTGGLDTGNGQGRRANVGEHDDLRFADFANHYIAEIKTAGGKFNDCPRPAQSHRLRAASAVVADGNGCRPSAAIRWHEGDADRATASRSHARAAGVGLGEIPCILPGNVNAG